MVGFLEISAIATVSFVVGYYVGWIARNKWEQKKHLFIKTYKEPKQKKRKKN